MVPEGQTVDTIAVPSVLAVFNWPKNTDRYRRVARFVEALYTKWDKFQLAPRHPKWRDVNLAATFPGWTRWSVADDMLRKLRQDAVAEAPSRERRIQRLPAHQDRGHRHAGAARSAVPRVPAVAAASTRPRAATTLIGRPVRG